jgi:hypothetical protein
MSWTYHVPYGQTIDEGLWIREWGRAHSFEIFGLHQTSQEHHVFGWKRYYGQTLVTVCTSVGNLQIIVLNKITVCAPASYRQFLRDLVELVQQWS